MIAYRFIALMDEQKEKVKGELFEVCHLAFVNAKPMDWLANCVFQKCKIVVKVELIDGNDGALDVDSVTNFIRSNRFVDCDFFVLIVDKEGGKADNLQVLMYDKMELAFDTKVDVNNTISIYVTQK